jgi:tetratricopeptide (TPR) repeat protein
MRSFPSAPPIRTTGDVVSHNVSPLASTHQTPPTANNKLKSAFFSSPSPSGKSRLFVEDTKGSNNNNNSKKHPPLDNNTMIDNHAAAERKDLNNTNHNANDTTTTTTSSADDDIMTTSTVTTGDTGGDDCAGYGYVLPTESQMVLMCLDYLRTLVRSHTIRELEEQHCLNHNAIRRATEELSQAFLPHSHTHRSEFKIVGEHEHGNEETKEGHTNTNTNSDEEEDVPLPPSNLHQGTDPFQLVDKPEHDFDDASSVGSSNNGNGTGTPNSILHRKKRAARKGKQDKKNHQKPRYTYLETHASNSDRFFALNGLSVAPPLSLGEVVSSGLVGLNARTRRAAEQDICHNDMFRQFLEAVSSRGFFENVDENENENCDNDGGEDSKHDVDNHNATNKRRGRDDEQYKAKFHKVVEKFRLKLAKQAAEEEQQGRTLLSPSSGLSTVATHLLLGGQGGGGVSLMFGAGTNSTSTSVGGDVASVYTSHSHSSSSSRSRASRAASKRGGSSSSGMVPTDATRAMATNMAELHRQQHKEVQQQFYGQEEEKDGGGGEEASSNHSNNTSNTGIGINTNTPTHFNMKIVQYHADDVEHAEQFKAKGNKCMQKKLYQDAIACYSNALRICPSGSNSHIYYSNRSAALLSLKQFEQACQDGERALALEPTYGKAHARLGWALYCLKHYEQAIDSYELAMKYDPDHASSHKKQRNMAKAKYEEAFMKEEEEAEQEEHEGDGEGGEQEETDQDENSQGGSNSNSPSKTKKKSKNNKKKKKSKSPKQKNRDPSASGSNHTTTNNHTKSKSMFNQEDQKAKQALICFKEAEALKAQANAFMAQRDYRKAIAIYTQAIDLCPHGPSSYIYFSNRSAALCYVEQYEEAELDAEESLTLNPDYGKAYARLGLSRFFLEDYEGSVDAYETALTYEPDNAASNSYLAKARAKARDTVVQAS